MTNLARKHLFLLLLFLFTAGGCSEKKKKAPVPDYEIGRPNLVILIIDTLRYDHVGKGTGNGKGSESVTGNIDRLADAGVRFSRAYSNAPWTFPAHASLFTGFEPHVHKQTHAAVYDKNNGPAVKKEAALPGRFETLAGVLQKNGYQTLGISQNPWVGTLSTQNHGFEHFWELWSKKQELPFKPRRGKELEKSKVTHAFLHFLDTLKASGKPFFLFVNYITCHLPYTPKAEYRNKHVRGFPPDSVFTLTSHNWLERKHRGELTGEEVDYLRRLYRAEVEQADAAVGEIITLLQDRNELKNTLLIVTSDHGECIGHHGFFDHQFNIYDDLVKIPLVMHHPGLPAGKTMKTPVQLTDIFPTVLQLSGLGGIREELKLPGMVIPLDPAWKGGTNENRPLFFLYRKGARVLALAKEHISKEMFDRYNGDICGVQRGKWKLVLTSKGEVSLYNTQSDPEETKKLSLEKHNETVEALVSLLRSHYKEANLPFSRLQ